MSVGLCQVAVYANTIRLVTTANAVLVATTAIRYKELHMTADIVRARTKEPAPSSWMRLSSVWSVPEDMEVSAPMTGHPSSQFFLLFFLFIFLFIINFSFM